MKTGTSKSQKKCKTKKGQRLGIYDQTIKSETTLFSLTWENVNLKLKKLSNEHLI